MKLILACILWATSVFADPTITITWNEVLDDHKIELVRDCFVESVYSSYATAHKLSTTEKTLEEWLDFDQDLISTLNAVFDNELEVWIRGEAEYCFFYSDNEFAGFSSFDFPSFSEERGRVEIYGRQGALCLDKRGQGLAPKIYHLINIQERYPEVEALVILVRKINQPARYFYEKVGFICNPDFTYGNYGDHYTGYEFPLK